MPHSHTHVTHRPKTSLRIKEAIGMRDVGRQFMSGPLQQHNSPPPSCQKQTDPNPSLFPCLPASQETACPLQCNRGLHRQCPCALLDPARSLTTLLLGLSLGSVVFGAPVQELLAAPGWLHVLNAHVDPLGHDAATDLDRRSKRGARWGECEPVWSAMRCICLYPDDRGLFKVCADA